jgi:hypothetical protein
MKDSIHIKIQVKKREDEYGKTFKEMYVSHYNMKPERGKTQPALLKKKFINRIRLTTPIQLQKLYTYKPIRNYTHISLCEK